MNILVACEESKAAYDVDNVIEQLKKIKDTICDDIKCSECKYCDECFEGEQSGKVAIDKAIEIVKKGALMI